MDPVEQAMQLWTSPVPPGDEGLAAFRALYRDPVVVNGVETPLIELVERARMLQGALEGLHHEVTERFEAPGRCAVAFRLSGRHLRPLTTPLGDVAPTGLPLTVLGLDLFVLDDEGMLAQVWAVADWLDLLLQAGAVAPA